MGMAAMGQTLAVTSMENQIREGDAKTFRRTSSKVLTGSLSVPLEGLNTEHSGYSVRVKVATVDGVILVLCLAVSSFRHAIFVYHLRHKCPSLTDSSHSSLSAASHGERRHFFQSFETCLRSFKEEAHCELQHSTKLINYFSQPISCSDSSLYTWLFFSINSRMSTASFFFK